MESPGVRALPAEPSTGDVTDIANFARMLRRISVVVLGFTLLLSVEWLIVGDAPSGATAVLLAIAMAILVGARRLLRRGHPTVAVFTVTGVILGLSFSLSWLPPATPALAAFPIVAASIALRHVTGRSLRRLLAFSWLTSIAVAIICETVPGATEMPAVYYAFVRVASFSAVIGLSLLLIYHFGVRLRESLAAAEASQGELTESEARYRGVIEDIEEVVFQSDAGGRWTLLNPAWTRITGHPAADCLGKPMSEWLSVEHGAPLAERLAALIAEGHGSLTGHLRLVSADGEVRWLEMRTHPAIGRDGLVGGLSGTLSDVTERRRLEAELTHLAFHDPLTALPNRALFRDRVDHTLLLSRRTSRNGAVLFLGLDGFKSVNDSLGHATGDRLLVEIAGRLQGCLRPGDTIARLGGDEFGILLEGVLEHEAAEVAVRLSAVAREPVKLDEHTIVGSASVGVAMLESTTASADEALRNADVAMYVAKVRRDGGHAIFRPEMRLASVERIEDLARLQAAIEHEEFYLEYQPIVDLSTGRLTGVEALVRWHHPIRGVVPPISFIPLAEESGLIVPLGAWVTREACRQLVVWDGLMQGGPGPTMSINVSAVQLANDGLVDEVADVLAETGVDPQRIVFEITETGLMTDPDSAEKRLRDLKGLGVRIAIDDFGTGYSSLAYLRRFPIDVLKLDRSFISGLERNGPSAALAEVFVQLGRVLHIVTVAEGVETTGEAELLRDLECHLAQGFQFSRPVDPASIAALLVADIPWEIGSPPSGGLALIA